MKALAFLLLLSGCTAAPTRLACVPPTPWSRAQQTALADELDRQDGPLAHRVVHEWEGYRAASRTKR